MMNKPMNKSVSRPASSRILATRDFTFHIFIPQVNHCIGVILILWLIASFGCSDDPEIDIMAAQKEQIKGWAAYDKGDFSTALLHFERVIELDATFADAYNGLGWAHLSISHKPTTSPEILAKAQQAFEGAIRSDASNADAWIGLANTLFLRRESAADFQTALRAIDNALQGNHQTLFRHDYKSSSDLYALGAVCYYYLNQTDLAISAIELSLQIEPSNTTALSLQQLLK